MSRAPLPTLRNPREAIVDRRAVDPGEGRIRVLRVIARLNVGGPAHTVSLLGGRLDPERYDNLVVHGRLGRGEGSFEHLAAERGCRVHMLRHLGPEVDIASDVRALRSLAAIVRAYRPHIVHTHTAKAGFVGRMAALLPRGERPIIVHTFHGHVLEGYFGPAKNAVYRALERRLAGMSDALLGVSRATVDDLVRLGVAPPSRFHVVPIGLELDPFLDPDPAEVRAFRVGAGAGDDDVLLACVGRLVPIKRIDVMLRAVAILRGEGRPVRLAVVGDGESRTDLERLAGELQIDDAVTFHGFVADSAPAAAAADIAVLSSDNEGTPVSLIEAAAAGRPAAATRVGGVVDVVPPGNGLLAPPGDPGALAGALRPLVDDPDLRVRMGRTARAHVLERYSADRLLRDTDELYVRLLRERAAQKGAKPAVAPPRAASFPATGSLTDR